VDASVVFTGGEVFLDDFMDEVGRRGVFFGIRFTHWSMSAFYR
jgi:hypothetical protein